MRVDQAAVASRVALERDGKLAHLGAAALWNGEPVAGNVHPEAEVVVQNLLGGKKLALGRMAMQPGLGYGGLDEVPGAMGRLL